MYRIITEDTNETNRIIELVTAVFPGFTMIFATGVYQGQRERSVIIEICADHTERVRLQVDALAKNIKALGAQECVLVQAMANSAWLV